MDLETDSPILESIKDNDQVVSNLSSTKSLGNGIVESSFQENGSHVEQNNDEMIINGTFSNSGNVEMKPEVTPKGHGLKKWRRIRRDLSKNGDSGIDKDKFLMPERPNPGERLKRVQVYVEKSPKSEGSASSTNAVVRNLDGFAFLGDNSEVLMGPLFAAGTDSENSEDQSNKSSTAASVPKVKFERPVVAGSLQGKTLNGKSLKGRTESTKKARGERVKIEKENSYSSMESDSRSSNFVFMQGNHFNGNGDVVYGSGHRDTNEVQGGYGGDGDRGYGDISHEGVVDDSWGVKEERDNDGSFSMDQDPLVESALALQSVQEALEKEVLKFKEIGKDIEEKLHETRSEQLLFEVEIELEDFFKQKIEAEVEHLVTSRTVQTIKTNIDQLGLVKEQKAMASEQTQILKKIGDNEKHAVMLKREAEKLENICEDIANADETLKLQNRVCKYTSCFFLQLVLLVVIVGIFIYKLPPPSSVQIVPT